MFEDKKKSPVLYYTFEDWLQPKLKRIPHFFLKGFSDGVGWGFEK